MRELALDALQPRAGERPSARSIDALLVHAIGTDTRLRFFRDDVIVFAGERCSLETTRVLRAARPALAARIEDLFGVEVCSATRDDAVPPLTADPPDEVVLAPWELDAESIPPAPTRRTPSSPRAPLASRSPRPSRLSEEGAPPPRARTASADRSAASLAPDCLRASDAADVPQPQVSSGGEVTDHASGSKPSSKSRKLRRIDELITLAVQTDTSLRILNGETYVSPGPSLDASTLPEFREARCLLARRLMDLFGARNIDADEHVGSQPSHRSPEDAEAAGREKLRLHALLRAQLLTVPLPSPKQTTQPPLPRPRGGALGSNLPPRQDAPTASPETPQ